MIRNAVAASVVHILPVSGRSIQCLSRTVKETVNIAMSFPFSEIKSFHEKKIGLKYIIIIIIRWHARRA